MKPFSERDEKKKTHSSFLSFFLFSSSSSSLLFSSSKHQAILLAIQFINATIGWYETVKAADAVAALKASLKPLATVKRGGAAQMGSTVVRGEVNGTVQHTGKDTFFGRTAMLLQQVRVGKKRKKGKDRAGARFFFFSQKVFFFFSFDASLSDHFLTFFARPQPSNLSLLSSPSPSATSSASCSASS